MGPPASATVLPLASQSGCPQAHAGRLSKSSDTSGALSIRHLRHMNRLRLGAEMASLFAATGGYKKNRTRRTPSGFCRGIKLRQGTVPRGDLQPTLVVRGCPMPALVGVAGSETVADASASYALPLAHLWLPRVKRLRCRRLLLGAVPAPRVLSRKQVFVPSVRKVQSTFRPISASLIRSPTYSVALPFSSLTVAKPLPRYDADQRLGPTIRCLRASGLLTSSL